MSELARTKRSYAEDEADDVMPSQRPPPVSIVPTSDTMDTEHIAAAMSPLLATADAMGVAADEGVAIPIIDAENAMDASDVDVETEPVKIGNHFYDSTDYVVCLRSTLSIGNILAANRECILWQLLNSPTHKHSFGLRFIGNGACFNLMESKHRFFQEEGRNRDIIRASFGEDDSPLVLLTATGTIVHVTYTLGEPGLDLIEGEAIQPLKDSCDENLTLYIKVTMMTLAYNKVTKTLFNHRIIAEDPYDLAFATSADGLNVITIVPAQIEVDAMSIIALVFLPDDSMWGRQRFVRIRPSEQMGVVNRQCIEGPAFDLMYSESIVDFRLSKTRMIVICKTKGWRIHLRETIPVAPVVFRLANNADCPYQITLSDDYMRWLGEHLTWRHEWTAAIQYVLDKENYGFIIEAARGWKSENTAEYTHIQEIRELNFAKQAYDTSEPLELELVTAAARDWSTEFQEAVYLYLRLKYNQHPVPVYGDDHIQCTYKINPTDTMIETNSIVDAVVSGEIDESKVDISSAAEWDGLTVQDSCMILASPLLGLVYNRPETPETWYPLLNETQDGMLAADVGTVALDKSAIAIGYVNEDDPATGKSSVHTKLTINNIWVPGSTRCVWDITHLLPYHPQRPEDPEAVQYMRIHNAKIFTVEGNLGEKYLIMTDLLQTILVLQLFNATAGPAPAPVDSAL